MRQLAWLVAIAACTSSAPPSPLPTPPPPVPPPVPPADDLAIVIRNDADRPAELDRLSGPDGVVDIVDAAGALAPIGLDAPPYGCEAACGAPHGPCGFSPPITIAPHASHRIAWHGGLRRLGKQADGWPCHDPIATPPGTYLLRTCADGGRCAVARVELPRREPIVLALAPYAPKPSCDPATVSRATRVAYAAAAREGIAVADCPIVAVCDGPQLDGTPGACRARVSRYDGVFTVDVAPTARDGARRAIQIWVDGDAIASGNFWPRDGTWGVAGPVFIAGATAHYIHTHGGDAAHISGATWRVYNRGDAPAVIELRAAAWVTSYATRPLAHATLVDGPRIVVAPHAERELAVSFEQQDAYQGWNDHFAVDATFGVGASAVHAVTDLAVSRVDPR